MNREQAIAAGRPVKDIIPSMLRRMVGHNYRIPGTYLITVTTTDRLPLLGTLVADPDPRIELSNLGRYIQEEAMPKMLARFKGLEMWRLCIMPDHVHVIFHIEHELPSRQHIGKAVASFKGFGTLAYREQVVSSCPQNSPEGVDFESLSLFSSGYNDRILFENGQLENWYRYLADNPRRLWLKRANPELFKVIRDYDLTVGAEQVVLPLSEEQLQSAPDSGLKTQEAYDLCKHVQLCGNHFLLGYPDIMPVIYHGYYEWERYKGEWERLTAEWRECGERGGVLISASIHEKEREFMREAFLQGYKVIKLRKEGFSDLYKPIGKSFDSTVEGRYLEISPWNYNTRAEDIQRSECLLLNRMAELIAHAPHTPTTDELRHRR